MASFEDKHRAFCVREYYRNNNSPTQARRKFCAHYNIRHKNKAPSIQSIKKWVQKFEETGSTVDKPRSGRPRTSRNSKTIERVLASFREHPELSTRERSSVLNISRTSLSRILHNDLNLLFYQNSLADSTKDISACKVAVVTGSNKGIGFAIVKGLCKDFKGIVYLTARDITRGQNAVKELKKLDLHPQCHQLDITDQESIDRFHDYIKNKYGGIDVLVNNATFAFKDEDSTTPFEEQAKKAIDINYFGTLKVCNKLFDLLRSNARVVNLSSSAGHLSRIPSESLRSKLSDQNLTVDGLSSLMKEFVESAKQGNNQQDGWGDSAYVVSKVGISSLTRIQQREISKDLSRPNIIVNSVHPGYVDTDMTSHKGHLTIEQGAEAPLYLALLPQEENNIKGAYVWFDRRVIEWTAPSVQ